MNIAILAIFPTGEEVIEVIQLEVNNREWAILPNQTTVQDYFTPI